MIELTWRSYESSLYLSWPRAWLASFRTWDTLFEPRRPQRKGIKLSAWYYWCVNVEERREQWGGRLFIPSSSRPRLQWTATVWWWWPEERLRRKHLAHTQSQSLSPSLLLSTPFQPPLPSSAAAVRPPDFAALLLLLSQNFFLSLDSLAAAAASKIPPPTPLMGYLTQTPPHRDKNLDYWIKIFVGRSCEVWWGRLGAHSAKVRVAPPHLPRLLAPFLSSLHSLDAADPLTSFPTINCFLIQLHKRAHRTICFMRPMTYPMGREYNVEDVVRRCVVSGPCLLLDC